jgi:hypothetical protein
MQHSRCVAIVCLMALTASGAFEPTRHGLESQSGVTALFRAGACSIDVSPTTFPVLINGGFVENRADRVRDRLHAKGLILDDGTTRLAIVVVDSCMMPRELIDRAKTLAQRSTGIPVERMLIAATHTHSAPAAMGALGCSADVSYAAHLPELIATTIEGAVNNLEPAQIGWNSIEDDVHTFCRRWIRRPDKLLADPFGEQNVRANMHPGYQSPDVIGPAGPVDPALTVLSVQSKTGRPLAVLANYSMHYYGTMPVSADYFGRFVDRLAALIGAQAVKPPFVGIMSQGTSGDQMWMDYGHPRNEPGIDAYAAAVASVANRAYQLIRYHDWVPLAMAETTLELDRRVPDRARLAWAKVILDRMNTDVGKNVRTPAPRTLPEVYAQEALFLENEPRRELKLQAIRIGDLGIAAIPNEVFAISGLKIKTRSPFETTFSIELANGAEGYILPPEQHALGGYTTWPARTAGLEVRAEPRIIATVLKLLEQVAGKAQRAVQVSDGPFAMAIKASRPVAYWRFDDLEGQTALDASTNQRHAQFDGGVALYLPGAPFLGLNPGRTINRAIHFAGGRMKAVIADAGEASSLELWFWNGLPPDARELTGYILSLGAKPNENGSEIKVGLTGRNRAGSRLFLTCGDDKKDIVNGGTEIGLQTWHHLALVCDQKRISVFLDGNAVPEVLVESGVKVHGRSCELTIGGSSDGSFNFEGKIAEVALFDRALSVREIAQHDRAARPELK